MTTITNLCTKPDKIRLDYNAGRIIGYVYYGDVCYRLLLVKVSDNTYKMTAIQPSIYQYSILTMLIIQDSRHRPGYNPPGQEQ